jgi:hypothetical protein
VIFFPYLSMGYSLPAASRRQRTPFLFFLNSKATFQIKSVLSKFDSSGVVSPLTGTKDEVGAVTGTKSKVSGVIDTAPHFLLLSIRRTTEDSHNTFLRPELGGPFAFQSKVRLVPRCLQGKHDGTRRQDHSLRPVRGPHARGIMLNIIVEVNQSQLPKGPDVIFTIPLVPRLHSIASEHTGNSRALPLSWNIRGLSGGRDEDHRTTEREAQRLRLRAESAEPRTAVRKRSTMDVKMISVVVEAIVRSSKRPETLRETSVNHACARPLKNVKVSSLNHGIALRHAGTTGFVQDSQVLAGSDDLT